MRRCVRGKRNNTVGAFTLAIFALWQRQADRWLTGPAITRRAPRGSAGRKQPRSFSGNRYDAGDAERESDLLDLHARSIKTTALEQHHKPARVEHGVRLTI